MRKEVNPMPIETPTAQRQLDHVRRFKLSLRLYVLALLVLTPVWIVTQYETSPGWPTHLSSRSRYPGDWDPWLIWVAVVGAVIVLIAGYRVHRDRTDASARIARGSEHLKSH
jgi:hypothetical protein